MIKTTITIEITTDEEKCVPVIPILLPFNYLHDVIRLVNSTGGTYEIIETEQTLLTEPKTTTDAPQR